MKLRLVAALWCCLCVGVALETALGMLVGFAPSPGRTGDLASAELAGLERARNLWLSRVWVASGMLALSGMAVLALGWKRR